jgi:uncharacterized iron-regulated membrane protein
MNVKKIHQLLGLCAAVFWLVQVVTGVLLTFRQEIDNALVAGPHATVVTAALGSRIESIQQAGGHVSSLWVTNFAVDRFDLRYTDSNGVERLMRVDGAGQDLRDGLENAPFANGGFFRTLTTIHTTLLLGDAGEWVIAVSGLLLISNLGLGLKLAWPRGGRWRQVLTWPSTRNATARVYGIHRTVGLWIALPLLMVFAAGFALCFDDGVEQALGVVRPTPTIAAADTAGAGLSPGGGVLPARALDIALARYPGSTLTALSMPTDKQAWYRVRVRAPGEVRRMYGTTTVFLSAATGAVLLEYPASSAPFVRFLYDAIYPLHTGELGGAAGRALLAVLGLALLTMGVFGIRLWLALRR